MPTPGPTYTPAQQIEHAEKARKDTGVVAEINTKKEEPKPTSVPEPKKV